MLLLVHVGVVSTALGFLLWIVDPARLPAGTASLNMLAIPVIALLSSMASSARRSTRDEWIGIACIGAGLALVTARNVPRALARGGEAARARRAAERLARAQSSAGFTCDCM